MYVQLVVQGGQSEISTFRRPECYGSSDANRVAPDWEKETGKLSRNRFWFFETLKWSRR